MRFAPFAKAGFVLVLAASFSACGGGGDNGSGGPPPATVTVSGKITFDRIPFDSTLGSGLNPNAVIESPARGVVVEAVAGTSVLASTVTNATGDYSFEVPSSNQIRIQAKAQMLKTDTAPTWNFRVLNNTNSDALYVLESSAFTSNANVTRNLRAASGWGGTSYTGTRAAAPFAILDTVYRAKDLILSAANTTTFPALNMYWSSSNRPTEGAFCIDDGDIGVTFYSTGGTDESECDGEVPEGMFVLGDFAQGDTDEFDQHVLAHEFGHYVEAKFSRSDSIGGQHNDGDKLDLRVAFGEGWGNAFSGMVLNDPVYRDSYSGMSSDFSINMEVDDARFSDGGWYSEASIAEILWDIFDSTNEPGDAISLGFAPIFEALAIEKNTAAFTSIFSFLQAVKEVSPSATAAINQLRNAEQISGSDEFGAGENNAGGDPSVLPLYRPITLNQPQQLVCVRATNGAQNGLGFNKYFRLDLDPGATVTVTVTGVPDAGPPAGTAAIDPDVFIYRRGEVVAFGTSEAVSTETISQTALPAGTYVIELYDYNLSSGSTPRCMTISVTGA
jgi:hypothetical protein